MARVPGDDPGQASDGELVAAGHAAPIPCVLREAAQQQEGCRPDGRQLLGEIGRGALVGPGFGRVGRSAEARIPAGYLLKSYRTARSAFPAVVLDPAGPCRESGKNGVEWRDSRTGADSSPMVPEARFRPPLWESRVLSRRFGHRTCRSAARSPGVGRAASGIEIPVIPGCEAKSSESSANSRRSGAISRPQLGRQVLSLTVMRVVGAQATRAFATSSNLPERAARRWTPTTPIVKTGDPSLI